jgi:small GTP-binding protein
LLSNIFLLKGNNFDDLNHLDIYSYPFDISKRVKDDFFKKVIIGHEEGCISGEKEKKKISGNTSQKYILNCVKFEIDSPIAQNVEDLNLFTVSINSKMIIGLMFDEEDNPYDYAEIFQELSYEMLNNEKFCNFEDEFEIENFLITLFIDIRRYGDEIIQKYHEIAFQSSEIFTKVFLFGIDDVGKSSLIRRLKTGQFNDNYFAPTKKFNIEYLQEDDGQLAIWDMPGNLILRKNWLNGIQDSNILIYMIDIANQMSFKESKEEFWKIVNRGDIKDIPIIIVANKVDLLHLDHQNRDQQLERAKRELMEYFQFKLLYGRNWDFFFTSVKTNYNVLKIIDSIFSMTESN